MNKVNKAFLISMMWLCVEEGMARAGEEEGKKIFEEKKCITCHSIGGTGGAMAKVGGPLDDVGDKRDAAWLKALLTDSQSSHPSPKQDPAAKEFEDLLTYLLSLKKPERP